MPLHPLTTFEIKKYQNKAKFIGVYSRNDLSKIKDGAYISLDEYESIVSKCLKYNVFYVNVKNAT